VKHLHGKLEEDVPVADVPAYLLAALHHPHPHSRAAAAAAEEEDEPAGDEGGALRDRRRRDRR
jgi:hypothetical protein